MQCRNPSQSSRDIDAIREQFFKKAEFAEIPDSHGIENAIKMIAFMLYNTRMEAFNFA